MALVSITPEMTDRLVASVKDTVTKTEKVNRAVKGPMTECGAKDATERKTCEGFCEHSNDPKVCIHQRFDKFCSNENLKGRVSQ